jgi:hypothetical protein
MKIKVVVVDLEIPHRVKKWALLAGLPLALVVGGGAVAWAGTLHTWNQGDTLNASDLNANFSQLSTDLAAVQAQTHPASGFRALKTAAFSVPAGGTATTVVFETVVFDTASEYNAGNGTFTAKNAGVYFVECGIEYTATATDNVYGAYVYRANAGGTAEIAGEDRLTGSGSVGTRAAVSTVVQLAAGDALTCRGYQNTGASVAMDVGVPARNSFSVARLY